MILEATTIYRDSIGGNSGRQPLPMPSVQLSDSSRSPRTVLDEQPPLAQPASEIAVVPSSRLTPLSYNLSRTSNGCNSIPGSRFQLPTPTRRFNVYCCLKHLRRLHATEFCLGTALAFLHCIILAYAVSEGAECVSNFAVWLGVLIVIAAVRLPPQGLLLVRVRKLSEAWGSRNIIPELVNIIRSVPAIINRFLSIVMFVWYFFGFHWAYTMQSCGNSAPVIYQYVTVLVLLFLALVGVNCVICIGSIVYLIYTILVPAQSFASMFQDESRRPKPVPLKILKKLPSVIWSSTLQERNNFDPICSICLSEYESGQQLRVLPCNHPFHLQCIDTWLGTQSTCPLRCHVNLLAHAFPSTDPRSPTVLLPWRERVGGRVSSNLSECCIPSERGDCQVVGQSSCGMGTDGDSHSGTARPLSAIVLAVEESVLETERKEGNASIEGITTADELPHESLQCCAYQRIENRAALDCQFVDHSYSHHPSLLFLHGKQPVGYVDEGGDDSPRSCHSCSF